MNTMNFTVQFRSLTNPRVRAFSVLSDALKWALNECEAFDVSVDSGAIVWCWEQR